MNEFTKIKDFKNTVSQICRLPTLSYEGTVKLHGTNAGVSYSKKRGLIPQSRNRELTIEKDNMGFAMFVESKKEIIEEFFLYFEEPETITIYGEWCGERIQNGMAINKLPKMWVIFAMKEKENYRYINWASEKNQIYNINHFQKYYIDIDFNNPAEHTEKIQKWIDEVEKECPVGKHFGVSGMGEGIVFTHYTNYGLRKSIFKVKGAKHKNVKKREKQIISPEKIKSINDFCDYAVTENRLKQGLENVDLDIRNTGKFIKWICQDIISEETDTLIANELIAKDFTREASVRARDYFLEKLKL